jgi:hypothetical protein
VTTATKSFSTILAIDPGATGGIARWKQGQPTVALAMPPTEDELVTLFRTLITPDESIAFVEHVTGFIGKSHPGSRMFVFGRNFGFILGVLQAMGVRTELVRPQKWQKPFSLGTASGCATRAEWKGKLKLHAQRLYPKLKPTLKTADALLLLKFALKSCGLR